MRARSEKKELFTLQRAFVLLCLFVGCMQSYTDLKGNMFVAATGNFSSTSGEVQGLHPGM